LSRILLVWLGLFSWAALAYETPQAIKKRYAYLYPLSVQHHSDGSKSFHQGKLFFREGIRVLSVAGDEFEMAFQHGRLLQKETHEGALPQTAQLLENAVRNAVPESPFISNTAVEVFYKLYSDRILKHAIQSREGDSEKILLEAYGLSEGAEIPLDVVIRGVLGPESLQVALGEKFKGKKGIPPAGIVSSCTDFVVKPTLTQKNGMVIGRNTDYSLNGYFDKYPTVIYYHPTDGSQNYLSVTSAGLHNAGVIGLNESGLFIGVHTIPTTEVSPDGNPVFLVGQEVMRKAKSFDEAVEIFKHYKSAAGWTYTLASVTENRSASIEITNQRVAVRESRNNYHVQSNHFLSPELANANLELNATITEDSWARMLRAEEMIQKVAPDFTAQDAVKILSDKWDLFNKEVRGIVNVIAVNTTLSSAVFDFSQKKLFVAEGMGPVSLNGYIELPLIGDFNESQMSDQNYEILKNDQFKFNYSKLYQAEQSYIRAKHALEMENNPLKAVQFLSESVSRDPDNAAYLFMGGILSLKAGLEKEAISYFNQALEKKYLHYRLVSLYYLARIEASRGKRESAIKKYQFILENAEPFKERTLRAATQKQITQLKRARKVALNPKKLSPFMPEADMLEY